MIRRQLTSPSKKVKRKNFVLDIPYEEDKDISLHEMVKVRAAYVKDWISSLEVDMLFSKTQMQIGFEPTIESSFSERDYSISDLSERTDKNESKKRRQQSDKQHMGEFCNPLEPLNVNNVDSSSSGGKLGEEERKNKTSSFGLADENEKVGASISMDLEEQEKECVQASISTNSQEKSNLPEFPNSPKVSNVPETPNPPDANLSKSPKSQNSSNCPLSAIQSPQLETSFTKQCLDKNDSSSNLLPPNSFLNTPVTRNFPTPKAGFVQAVIVRKSENFASQMSVGNVKTAVSDLLKHLQEQEKFSNPSCNLLLPSLSNEIIPTEINGPKKASKNLVVRSEVVNTTPNLRENKVFVEKTGTRIPDIVSPNSLKTPLQNINSGRPISGTPNSGELNFVKVNCENSKQLETDKKKGVDVSSFSDVNCEGDSISEEKPMIVEGALLKEERKEEREEEETSPIFCSNSEIQSEETKEHVKGDKKMSTFGNRYKPLQLKSVRRVENSVEMSEEQKSWVKQGKKDEKGEVDISQQKKKSWKKERKRKAESTNQENDRVVFDRYLESIQVDEKEDEESKAVRQALKHYDYLRRKFLKEGENGKPVQRPDLKAASVMRDQNKTVNCVDKFGKMLEIIGSVPGVPVGMTFCFRQELSMVGLHRQAQAGIDYLPANKNRYHTVIAVAVISSGGYSEDVDRGDFFEYTGQGGNNSKASKKENCDQEMVRGNLALKNSCDLKIPVRVIRGCKGNVSISNSNSERGLVYTYDGLYKVESWRETRGETGHRIYKFRLVKFFEDK